MVKPRIAILGTGRMGSAAAERLASLGYEIYLWNRTREKAEKLANTIGASVARDPAHAAGSAEAALAFLADDDALLAVLASIRRSDGLLFINMGTHRPKTSRYSRNYIESNGGCYVESPIVAGPGALRKGKAIIIYSGRKMCALQAQPILSDLAEHLLYLGEDPGQAQALKLAYNSLLITTVASIAQSLRLAEKYGVSKESFKELLSLTAFSPLVDKYIDRLTQPIDEPASFTAMLAAKDLHYAGDAGFEEDVPMPLTLAGLTMYLNIPPEKRSADYTRIYHFIGK